MEAEASAMTRSTGEWKVQMTRRARARTPNTNSVWRSNSKLSAKSLAPKSSRMDSRTARRGGLAPARTVRPRYSQAASMETAAVARVNRSFHLGGRKTRSRTTGTRTRAVRMRFIPGLRIHCRAGVPASGPIALEGQSDKNCQNVYIPVRLFGSWQLVTKGCEMKQSDQVRAVAGAKFVRPALAAGKIRFSVAVRDVLKDLVADGFPPANTPQVCSA